MTSETTTDRPGAPFFTGLFLVTASLLMYEVLLPRVFSVTMFYHYAFMAISVAMFGATVGAIVVQLRPERYTRESAPRDLAWNSLWFSLTTALSFLVYLCIPFRPDADFMAFFSLALSFAVVAVPFVFGGIAITVALTKVTPKVGLAYAADLAGAAVGCVVVLWAIDLTDAPSAVLITSGVAALGAVLFGMLGVSRGLRLASAGTVVGLLVLAAFNAGSARAGRAPIRIVHRVLSDIEPIYSRWNSFSYVEVSGDPEVAQPPFAWGSSPVLSPHVRVRQLMMSIDVKAATPITQYDGNTRDLGFLEYDVTNVAHHLRPKGDVCIVGVGGGRDVLTSLRFGHRSILGIELNDNVLYALNHEFGEFSGHLDRLPEVELVVDEARSRLARVDRDFDLIQISLIDTFAATAAGALVLAENTLYTVEAWELFLERLKPGGVLSVSRYYFHERPAEAYRMLSLAVEALRRRGIKRPSRHVILVKNEHSPLATGAGVGTLLVSPDPFPLDDLKKLNRIVRTMRFEIVATPRQTTDRFVGQLMAHSHEPGFYDDLDFDLSPPTDDRPFFFQMMRLGDAFDPELWNPKDVNWKNVKAVLVLWVLLGITLVMAAICVGAPLVLGGRPRGKQLSALFALFACIGLGFMFVEVAQLQRLTMFLGHPTYALSVVLFTLLLAGGAGSLVSSRLFGSTRLIWSALGALLVLLIAVGAVTPAIVPSMAGASTAVRVAVASATLAPIGFFMGVPFPAGLRLSSELAPGVGPWLWAVNGATSVCASVIAAVVAQASGISTVYWLGFGCYALALGAYVLASRPPVTDDGADASTQAA